MMKLIYKRRLERLARHLEAGKLAHAKFDFAQVNVDRHGSTVDYACGYAGCAIGELPAVFPKYFKFGWIGRETAQEFLGLSNAAGLHLFIPNSQAPKLFGGKALSRKATRKQVAANIRAFIAKRLAPTPPPSEG